MESDECSCIKWRCGCPKTLCVNCQRRYREAGWEIPKWTHAGRVVLSPAQGEDERPDNVIEKIEREYASKAPRRGKFKPRKRAIR